MRTARMNGLLRGTARWLVFGLVLCLVLLVGGTTASAASSQGTHGSSQQAQQAKKPAFPLEITCTEAWNGVTGLVCVHTQPGAKVSVRITYCNGRIVHDDNLADGVANGKGDYSWSWTPQTSCKTAKAQVTAKWSGKVVRATKTFPIHKPMDTQS